MRYSEQTPQSMDRRCPSAGITDTSALNTFVRNLPEKIPFFDPLRSVTYERSCGHMWCGVAQDPYKERVSDTHVTFVAPRLINITASEKRLFRMIRSVERFPLNTRARENAALRAFACYRACPELMDPRAYVHAGAFLCTVRNKARQLVRDGHTRFEQYMDIGT